MCQNYEFCIELPFLFLVFILFTCPSTYLYLHLRSLLFTATFDSRPVSVFGMQDTQFMQLMTISDRWLDSLTNKTSPVFAPQYDTPTKTDNSPIRHRTHPACRFMNIGIEQRSRTPSEEEDNRRLENTFTNPLPCHQKLTGNEYKSVISRNLYSHPSHSCGFSPFLCSNICLVQNKSVISLRKT